MGSFSRRRSLAKPIVGVCDVAIAPIILAMIGILMETMRLSESLHHGIGIIQSRERSSMSTLPTRRDIIRLIGASAAAAIAPRPGAAGEPLHVRRGAIIRTVLEDLPPAALAGGATLFHEHLSVGADFMPKVMAQ